MFNQIFEKMDKAKFEPMDEQIKTLLQKTWAGIAADTLAVELCAGRTVTEGCDTGDMAKVSADVARTAVYSNIFMWQNTKEQKVLDEWCEKKVQDQNRMLIEVFPDGRVYGV